MSNEEIRAKVRASIEAKRHVWTSDVARDEQEDFINEERQDDARDSKPDEDENE